MFITKEFISYAGQNIFAVHVDIGKAASISCS